MVAFGKHPGWDDHIPDIGQMTPRLIEVKRVLYVEGIGGSIDAGLWDKLEDDQRLDGFSHLFLWRFADEVVVGRIWSSSDGKGRKRYPMIVCARCQGLPVSWIVTEIMPRFEAIQQRCVAATSSTQVKSVIESSQAELQRLAQQADTANEAAADASQTLAWLAERPEMGADHEGLLRILYQLNPDAIINPSGGKPAVSGHAKHIRVPACDDSPTQMMLRWAQFVTAWVRADDPVLMVFALGQSWVDLLLGPQVGPRIYGIRVKPNKLPLTTDIPYNLDEGFVNKARRLISQALGGEDDAASKPVEPDSPPEQSVPSLPTATHRPAPPQPAAEGTAASGSSRFAKTMFVFAAVVAVLVGLYFLNESDLLDDKYKVDTSGWVDWLKKYFY